MSNKLPNKDEKKSTGHKHMNHMWLMALCCGIPIIGLIAIASLGIASPSLETLILLICPIGMVGMMYMMHRDQKSGKEGGSCCSSSEKDETKSEAENVDTEVNGAPKLTNSSTFKA